MSTAVSRRRGTTAEHATFTGIESEITVDTDVYTLVVHDGVTAGGYRLRRDYVDTTNVLLGRSSASSGAIENITIGSGLVLTGGVLHATGGSSFGGADASYLTLGTHASLSNERVFSPGNGLQATDNGANGTYDISVKTSDFLGSYALTGEFIRTGNILSGTGISIFNSGQYVYINVNTSSFLGQYALTSNVPSNAATYLTLSTDVSLSNERTFTVATGIEAIDGGAGNPYTITIKTSDFLGSYALTGSFIRTGNILAGTGVTILNSGHYTYINVSTTADHGSLAGLLDDDHSQYIYTSPDTSVRNVIEVPGDFIPLILRGSVGQTENLFEVQNDSAGVRVWVDSNFKLWAAGGLDAGSDKITSVLDPTSSQDAVTLNYLTGNYTAYSGSTATGLLLIGNGTTLTGLPVGTNDQVLAVTGNTIQYKTPYNTFSWWVTFHNRPLTVSVTGGTATYAVADVSLANQTDADGWVGGRSCADSNITWLAWQFPCPDELDTTQPVNANVYYRIGAAGANQVELKTVARVVDRDQSLNSGGNYTEATGTTSLAGYSSDDLGITGINNVLTGGMISTNNREWVKGTLIRDATAGNAADTFAGTIIIMGMKFTGTRKKWS